MTIYQTLFSILDAHLPIEIYEPIHYYSSMDGLEQPQNSQALEAETVAKLRSWISQDGDVTRTEWKDGKDVLVHGDPSLSEHEQLDALEQRTFKGRLRELTDAVQARWDRVSRESRGDGPVSDTELNDFAADLKRLQSLLSEVPIGK